MQPARRLSTPQHSRDREIRVYEYVYEHVFQRNTPVLVPVLVHADLSFLNTLEISPPATLEASSNREPQLRASAPPWLTKQQRRSLRGDSCKRID